MNKKLAVLGAIVIASLSIALGACGGGGGGSGGAALDDTATADLSAIALAPDPSWHDSYRTGSHTSYDCSSCHTSVARVAAREIAGADICAQCHSADYNKTLLFNHQSHNVGTYCNSCHYSDTFRSRVRVAATSWHTSVTASCESCHTNRAPSSHSDGRTSGCANCHKYSSNSWAVTSSGTHSTANCVNCHSGRTPANHYGSTCESCHSYPSWKGAAISHASYTSGCSTCHSGAAPANHYGSTCESCHGYPSWKGASFTHGSVTTNCASCHTKHYSGYACEWCHTSGISWKFKHSQVSGSSCNACHGSGVGDDDDDDDGEDDDDDDEGDDGDHRKAWSL